MSELDRVARINEMYQRFAELRPGGTSRFFHWGCDLFIEGEFSAAADKFRQHLKSDPGHSMAQLCLGFSLLCGGEFDGARLAYERAKPHPALPDRLSTLFEPSPGADRSRISIREILDAIVPAEFARAQAMCREFESLSSSTSSSERALHGAVFQAAAYNQLADAQKYFDTAILLDYIRLIPASFLCDLECINDFASDYERVIQELVAISRGHLEGTVVDRIHGGSPSNPKSPGPTIVLAAGSGAFEKTLRNCGDWLDDESLLALMNSLLKSKNADLEYRIFNPWGGQDVTICCLSPRQHDLLKSLHDRIRDSMRRR